ncbi:MAG: type III pantothenate kinase [Ruminococcaceae bacterium]|nr:type III pantothenate kinase [Oscillospiraceae bacterium]
MILAVNVGNTHIVFGLLEGDSLVERMLKLPAELKETSVGYAARIKQSLELVGADLSSVEGSILSSVVPPLTEVLKEAIFLLCGKTPLVVGAGIKTGLHILIDDPGSIAADLVAMAVAAKEKYPLPCVILDMGTATTLICVNEAGKYIGGVIMPGVNISMEALCREASLLPRFEMKKPKKIIASSTVDSLCSGILFGSAGAIDGVLDRFSEELGNEPATIVSTGGVAGILAPFCRHEWVEDEALLLKGLGIIYNKNEADK